MTHRFRHAVVLLFGALSFTLSCGGDDPTAPRVPAAIVLVPNAPVVSQGLTLALSATVVDVNGRKIRGKHPVFSSADTTIATVSADGLITSKGPLGTVRITADLNGLTGFVDLSVAQRIVGIKVFPESLVLNRTLTAGLSAGLVDYQDNPAFPPGVQFLFSSSNDQVATVDVFGQVYAPGPLGDAVITVQADTFQVDVPVHVVAIPDSIAVTPVGVLLQPNGSVALNAAVLDVAGLPIAGIPVMYQASGSGVLSISPAGVVTSLGPAGSGSITLTADTLQRVIGYRVGNVPTGQFTMAVVGAGAYGVAINAGGEMAVTALDGKVHRGALSGRMLPDQVDVGALPLGISLSPDGQTAWVAVGDDHRVVPVDLAGNTAGTPSPVLQGGTTFATAASPDGQFVYAGTNDYLYKLSAADLSVVDSAPVAIALHLVHHPTMPLLYFSESGSGSVVELNTATMARVRSFPVGTGPQGVALSPDGATLYAVTEWTGHLSVINLGTGIEEHTVILAGPGFGLAVSQELIVVTEAQAGRIQLFDRTSLLELLNVQTPASQPRRPAIHGSTILVPDEYQSAVVFID